MHVSLCERDPAYLFFFFAPSMRSNLYQEHESVVFVYHSQSAHLAACS